MGSLLRKITGSIREEARRPGSWGVFAFLGLANVGQAIFADSTPARLVFLVIAGLSMYIALRYFRYSRVDHRARAD